MDAKLLEVYIDQLIYIQYNKRVTKLAKKNIKVSPQTKV